jgi:hypothetical protein
MELSPDYLIFHLACARDTARENRVVSNSPLGRSRTPPNVRITGRVVRCDRNAMGSEIA